MHTASTWQKSRSRWPRYSKMSVLVILLRKITFLRSRKDGKPLYRFHLPDWEGWSNSCNVHSKLPKTIIIPNANTFRSSINRVPWTQWRWHHRWNDRTEQPWRPLRYLQPQMPLCTCIILHLTLFYREQILDAHIVYYKSTGCKMTVPTIRWWSKSDQQERKKTQHCWRSSWIWFKKASWKRKLLSLIIPRNEQS